MANDNNQKGKNADMTPRDKNGRKIPVNLEYFLGTPEGAVIGGFEAGADYLADEMESRYGIDLYASMEKRTGSRVLSKTKILAKDIVFTNDSRGLKGNAFFYVDPLPQPGNFDMPNITIKSFNSSVDDKLSSSPFLIAKLKDYRESLKTGNVNSHENLAQIKEQRDKERQRKLEESRILKEKREKQEIEKKRRAIQRNNDLWKSGSMTKDSSAPYFQKKGMNDIHKLAFMKNAIEPSDSGNAYSGKPVSLVPLYGIDGGLKNFQKITAEGDKILAEGAEAKGVFLVIGGKSRDMREVLKSFDEESKSPNKQRIHFAEGLATSYAVHKITNEPVVFCLNSNNLQNVVESFRERYKEHDFVIAADNDKFKLHSGNAGLKSASIASIYHKATLTYPEFKESDNDKRMTDWDDYVAQYGMEDAKKAYLGESNTKDYTDVKEEYKDGFSKIAEIRYSGADNAWDKIESFVFPKGDKTSPKAFLNRMKSIADHVPETASMVNHGKNDDPNGKDKFHVLPMSGASVFDFSISEIINGDDKFIGRLNDKSREFMKESVMPYVDANMDVLQELSKSMISSSPKASYENCSNEKTKELLTTKVLGKNQEAYFVSDMPMGSMITDSFYANNVSLDKTTKKVMAINGLNRDGHGVKVDISVSHNQSRLQEWKAVGNGKDVLKDVAENKRSKTINTGFNISSITFNGKNIPNDAIDVEAVKSISNYMTKETYGHPSQSISKERYEEGFHLRTLDISEEPKKTMRKNLGMSM